MRPPHDRPRPLRSGATACATARHSRPPGDGHRARFTGAPRAPPPDNPVTAGVERLAEALYELAGGPQLVITRLFHILPYYSRAPRPQRAQARLPKRCKVQKSLNTLHTYT